MDYTTVFDLSTQGWRTWPFFLPGIFISAVVWMFLRYHQAMRGGRAPSIPVDGRLAGSDSMLREPGLGYSGTRIFLWFIFAFAIFWTVFAFGKTLNSYLTLKSALADGKATVVTGAVVDYQPQRDQMRGTPPEHFCVEYKCFDLRSMDVRTGFNETRLDGSPIREGLLVRLAYVGDTIVKLEIAQQQPPVGARAK